LGPAFGICGLDLFFGGWVEGLGFVVWVLGSRPVCTSCLVFGVWCLVFGIQGLWFGVGGFMCGVEGSGMGVSAGW
jgi:hypothetical protein